MSFKLRVGDIVRTKNDQEFLITGCDRNKHSIVGGVYYASSGRGTLAWNYRGDSYDGAPELAYIIGGITR